MEGKTLCEIHYEQGRLRQMKVTVPESLKIKRGSGGGGEKIEKRLKRERALEALENNSDKGMKRMKAELIRVFLRREIIESSKKSEKGSGNVGEVTRDLPYGLMAIPPAPPTQFLDSAGSLGIKVGVHGMKSTVNRRFRSKNIEPPPISSLKVVPYVGKNLGKVRSNGRRKCHWCQKTENRTLTKCLSCRKRFFCSDCIKERFIDPQEVKQRCPVCRGSCDCKSCRTTRVKDVGTEKILKEQCKGSKFQHLQYSINYLLPVLVRINQEQCVEVEMEAKLKGLNFSEVEIRQADVGCGDSCCCNNCKSPILDFHRSCPNCSYNLCLSCCREYSRSGSLGGVKSSTSQYHNRTNAHFCLGKCSEKLENSTYDSKTCLLSCPPMELGGCDNSLLDLRCIFPLNWTKELEISAKEMAPEPDFLQTRDDPMHCTFCTGISQEADKSKELLEASRRKESEDNFLYCPCTSDDHQLLAHFQKHWQMGQPVKVHSVLQGVSNLSWDPLAMFTSYLEKGFSNYEIVKDAVDPANHSDWYDVEIGTKDSFTGSTVEGYTHVQCETLKVKAKLSSALSRRLFEGHYREIVHSLPLQEYINPRSGLLNLAGKLPEDLQDYKLGPHVCISCGSREEVARGELEARLCCNSFDVVNILVHADDASCSTEQINKIKKLIRRNNVKGTGGCTSHNLEHDEMRMDSGLSVSCSAATNGASGVNLKDDKSPDTDSDASMICSGTNGSPEKSVNQISHLDHLESSGLSYRRHLPEPCGAQWDVFRRQDIPKLLEYIAEHADELSYCYGLRTSVVHPILDGSFYLDVTHKMRLKEEFKIEPWTFNQCLGEAVFIPAGCPYQIRNIKSCVNIAVGFVSPESASECIKLIDEIRVLPNTHKAKQHKLEVEKMTICSIDEAIKEMYRLRSEDRSNPDIREV